MERAGAQNGTNPPFIEELRVRVQPYGAPGPGYPAQYRAWTTFIAAFPLLDHL